MEDLGIDKNKFKEGYFKEFNILDMYDFKGKKCF